MRSALRTVAFAVSAWLALAPAAHAEVQLSLRNGRVTLIATNATVRQILAEWARVGKTRIVNAERIPGGPLTIELRDVPEGDALDILLRSLSGYMTAPRTTAAPADASVFDAIAVMPTVASTARVPAPSSAPAPFSPPPVFNQNEEDQENGQRPAQQPARPPIFSTFPTPQPGAGNPAAARPTLPVVRPGAIAQPPQVNPNDVPGQPPSGPLPQVAPPPSAPSSSPGGAPIGVSAPGMIAPAPGAAQPGQPQRPQGE